MGEYITIQQLKSKIKQTVHNKKIKKLYFINSYRKELSRLWPVLYKKQYYEKFYGTTAKKWMITKRIEAISIFNLSYTSTTDNELNISRKTDLNFYENKFAIFEICIKYSDDKKINSLQSLNIRTLDDESLLKLLNTYKLFMKFSGNIENIIGEPTKKLLDEHEEEEILNLLDKLLIKE
ncbi:MAG: hypothetical protein KAJ47_00525 [Candidatus Aenigmarchaeota archaeon]|nr:hypothetical protein [Candidatus Aenigmarchaeota archaeon]